jgi:hypothetical protein
MLSNKLLHALFGVFGVFLVVFCCSVCFFIVFSSCNRGWLCDIRVILCYPLYLCSGVLLL